MKAEIALARTAAGIGGYGVRSHGGMPAFSQADAAHALAGAPPLGARLLLIKFGSGTDDDVRRLAIELSMEVASLTEAPARPQVAGIDVMQAVVRESMSPGVCNDCAGHGWIAEGARHELCDLCEGTGRGSWSNSRRARECRMDRNAFRSTAWRAIYEDALRVLVLDEILALEWMGKRLRE